MIFITIEVNFLFHRTNNSHFDTEEKKTDKEREREKEVEEHEIYIFNLLCNCLIELCMLESRLGTLTRNISAERETYNYFN